MVILCYVVNFEHVSLFQLYKMKAAARIKTVAER